MITIEQCRAARGLLGWTQQDLADQTGLSKTAINNFERGLADTKQVSLLLIRDAFEKGGAEFPTPHSVGRKIEDVSILKGESANTSLWDDIFETLKQDGGEVLISSVDEKRVLKDNAEGIERHLARLAEHNITERMLACEGDDTFLQPIDCYRWINKELFAALSPTFIYGDKVAMKLWKEKMIIIVKSPDAASAERRRFNYLWDNAMTPKKGD